MDINRIVAELDTEIARLQRAREALTGLSSNAGAGRRTGRRGRRRLSAAARARIAAAQRARWAKLKAAKKK